MSKFLLTLDKVSFFRLQLQRHKQQLLDATEENEGHEQEVARWRERYLAGETVKFNQLKEAEEKLEEAGVLDFFTSAVKESIQNFLNSYFIQHFIPPIF